MSIKWTRSQLSAIRHKKSDLIVSAAAGSGKTATLAERILRKIKKGESILNMLVVTFTKAAASELKNKISNLIGDELKLKPSDAHLSEEFVNSSYADICTIDSFCMKLVRANFDKLMLDGNFRIGDTGEIAILEKQTMEELIDELFENEADNDDFLLVSDCYSSIWSEEELANALLDLRSKLLTTADSLKTLLKTEGFDSDFIGTPYGRVLIQHINEATCHFIPFMKDAIDFLGTTKIGTEVFMPIFSGMLNYLERIKNSIDNNDDYDTLKSVINSVTLSSLPTKKLETDEQKEELSYFRKIYNSFTKEFKDIQETYFVSNEKAVISSAKQNAKMCRAIYNILVTFEERLLNKKRLFSVYTFNDISNFALELLYNKDGSRSDFAIEISAKYKEVYIDEYQDTNSIQDKIFRAISKKNRFMVGDIKQSIYRFRSAEPEIFSYYRNNFTPTRLYKKGCLGKSIFMSSNFRCDEPIIDFSNLVSDYMFKNSNGIPYSDEDRLIFPDSKRGKYKEKATEVHLIDSSTLPDDVKIAEYQADYVARQIKHLIDSKEERLPSGKRIKPSNIAILLRYSTKQIPIYVRALKKYGIDSLYQSNEAFFEKPHIMLALCLLNVIDNPSKDIYLAGAMRSDVFGFTLEDLVKINKKVTGNSKKTASLYSILKNYKGGKKLKGKIDAFLRELNSVRQSVKRMASHEVLSTIYEKWGLLTICSAQEKIDFLKLYNIAREYEKSSYKGLYSFIKHIDDLATDYDSSEFKGDVTRENVKLMSIHASKGLEFDICFVCGTESNFIYRDIADDLLFQREMGIAGFVGEKDGLARFEPLIRKCIAIKKIREMHEEEMRILYVALTRAKHRLIVTGGISHPEEKLEFYKRGISHISPYEIYNASSALKYVLGAITEANPCYKLTIVDASDGTSKDGDKKTRPKRKEIDMYKDIIKERFAFKYPYEHLAKIPSKMSVSRLHPEVLDGTQNEDIDIPELSSIPKFLATSENKVTGAERGIAAHVFMQFCDFNAVARGEIKEELKRLVDSFYMSKEDAEIVIKKQLYAFAKSDLLKEILKAKNVYKEFRFNVLLDASLVSKEDSLKGEKVLVQGVTDCIYENDAGELVLVDYKTDYVTYDNYESYLTNEYKDQLRYYKEAIGLIFDKPIAKVLIYSIRLAKTVDLTNELQ